MILANRRLRNIHCTVAGAFLKPVANVLYNYCDRAGDWLYIQTRTKSTELLPSRAVLLFGICGNVVIKKIIIVLIQNHTVVRRNYWQPLMWAATRGSILNSTGVVDSG